jgi:ribosomal protein S18 acetylase RimI-like enzyme
VGDVTTANIRPYVAADEVGWLQCRLLSFFGSAFYDDVVREKERYERPAIELVADVGGEIIGLIDVECEEQAGTVCFDRPGLGGMIWHVAVHPEHQRRGIAADLVAGAERYARERGVVRLEAWTRDDPHVQAWYESLGFAQVSSYLHVYLERDEGLRNITFEDGKLKLVKAFAHYTGDEPDAIRKRFRRVHDCVHYERKFE